MIVAADEAIPYLQEALSRIGDVRLFSGRSVPPSFIRDADALIVRSVTRVDARLLEGSAVRFVGTATVGIDHLDLDYLKGSGIRCASAAGCNANAVAEYVVAALLVMAERKGWLLSRKSIGIIGVGHVGTLVQKRAAALGMEVLLCDPPLRESTGDVRYGFLDDVRGADILTLHVPLTTEGPYPTRHMIGREVLQRLSSRQLVINTSRGDVVRGADLKETLRMRKIAGAVLDVWENEPGIDRTLLDLVDLGTAHVAGSSLDGKVRATAMVLEELSRFWGIAADWDGHTTFPSPRHVRPEIGSRGQDAVSSVVHQAYDILRDDRCLRAVDGKPEAEASALFDNLRDNYPLRPEFSHFVVELAAESTLAPTFRALGFTIAEPD